MRSVFLLLILYLFSTSCTSSLQSTPDKSAELKRESKLIFSQLKLKEMQGQYFIKTPIDSIEREWAQIFQDSAELGYQFIQEFDSLFKQKNEAARVYQLKNVEKEIKRLATNFTYEEDEFKDVGFYTHKRWGKYWPNRKTLTSGVNSSGYVWLRSNYSADDWIFHTSITVLVGDDKYQSEQVPTFSDKNVRDNDAGRVWERITFNNTDILKAIAENPNATVKVRFNGREFYSDQTLSSSDKKALKDCYDLAQAIKKKQSLTI